MDVVIYGSCVTRDMWEAAAPEGAKLLNYIARQSWCSVGSPVHDAHFTEKTLSSQFQNRQFTADVSGNALDQIRAAFARKRMPALLIDLTDERHGILEGPDGQIMTYNDDAARQNLYQNLPPTWERRSFGSALYGMAWFRAAVSLKQELKDIGAWNRTAIIANRWALTDTQGAPLHATPEQIGTMNDRYEEIYTFLESEGWNLLRPDNEAPLADPDHRWGPAPFHYEQSYYRDISRKVASFLTQLEEENPV